MNIKYLNYLFVMLFVLPMAFSLGGLLSDVAGNKDITPDTISQKSEVSDTLNFLKWGISIVLAIVSIWSIFLGAINPDKKAMYWRNAGIGLAIAFIGIPQLFSLMFGL